MSTGEKRDLFFPLNRSLSPETETPDDPLNPLGVQWPTSDPNERVNVVYNVSYNEHLILSSAVDSGSDVSYGSRAIYVWWLWQRSVRILDFCETVLECIIDALETDEPSALQEQLQNLLGGTGGYGPQTTRPLTASERSSDLFGGLGQTDAGTCDDEALWAMCQALAVALHDSSIDLLQKIDAAVNRAKEITGYFQVAYDVAGKVQAWTQVAQDLVANVLPLYESTYTQGYEDALACAFYCKAKEHSCTMTVELALQVFEDRSVTGVFSGLLDVIQYAASGTVTGTALLDAMHATTLASIAYSNYNDWIGRQRDFAQVIRLGAGDANDGYLALCPQCATNWGYSVDWLIEDDGALGFVPVPDQTGTYVSGQGMTPTVPGNPDRTYFGLGFTGAGNVKDVRIFMENPLPAIGRIVITMYDDTGASVNSTVNTATGTQDYTKTLNWPYLAGYTLMFGFERAGTDTRIIGNMTGYNITGDGDNPYA